MSTSVHCDQKIDRHSVVAFFQKAEWTELVIMHEINRVLGENTITYSTASKYGREFICGPKDKDSFIVQKFEGDFTRDVPAASVLADAPFLSFHQIAKRVMMSKPTVYHHLTSGMGWRLKHLRWVPHGPTDVAK
jgi:DNA-binding transcriptional ArsR family regulator